MGQSADQIAQELDQKRSEASEKITMIENQVSKTAEDVKETVKESVDLRKQVEERPLMSLGVAFVGGILLGGLVGGDNGQQNGSRRYAYEGNAYDPLKGQGQGSGLMNTLRQAAKSSGLEDSINSAAAAMMASAGDRIKSTMQGSNAAYGNQGSNTMRSEAESGQQSVSTSSRFA